MNLTNLKNSSIPGIDKNTKKPPICLILLSGAPSFNLSPPILYERLKSVALLINAQHSSIKKHNSFLHFSTTASSQTLLWSHSILKSMVKRMRGREGSCCLPPKKSGHCDFYQEQTGIWMPQTNKPHCTAWSVLNSIPFLSLCQCSSLPHVIDGILLKLAVRTLKRQSQRDMFFKLRYSKISILEMLIMLLYARFIT